MTQVAMESRKNHMWERYVVLVLSCILMIGNYYCFDNPAALKLQLQSHFHTIEGNQFEFLFNCLYSIYSIPNIILPFLGGRLVDKLGVRMLLVSFSSIILCGQMIFALGCSVTSIHLMLFGRFIFGLGGECLGVAQSALLVSWFKGTELAFALGINLSVARLGSVINNIISPMLAEKFDVTTALWFGSFVCIISLVSVCLLLPIDRKADNQAERTKSFMKTINTSASTRDPTLVPAHTKKRPSGGFIQDLRQFGTMFWCLAVSCLVVYGCVIPFNNIASSLLMERNYFKLPPVECQRCGAGVYANLTNCLDINAQHCPPTPPYAWPLPNLSSNCTPSHERGQDACTHVRPYIRASAIDCGNPVWKTGTYTKIYCAKRADAERSTATPMSTPYLMSAILSPVLGHVVDRIGMRALLAFIAPLLLTLVHLSLGLTHVNPWIPLISQGCAYSIFAAALWPSVPCTLF